MLLIKKETKLYLIVLLGLLCVERSFALNCYSCNEYDDRAVGCSDFLSGQELAAGLTATCTVPTDKCVVFENPSDGSNSP